MDELSTLLKRRQCQAYCSDSLHCVCACVCVRERERKEKGDGEYACVYIRKTEKFRECVHARVCVCMCVTVTACILRD